MLYPVRKQTNSKSRCQSIGCLSLAVRKFCIVSEERCRRGYDWCVQNLFPDVVYWHMKHIRMIAATVYVTSNCELSSHHARILRGGQLHGGPCKTTELSKSRGGRL